MKDKRLALLNQMLAENPTDNFLLYAIPLEHYNSGDYQVAKTGFSKLQAIAPDYLPTYYQYALSLIHLGEIEEAEEVLAQGIVVADAAGERKTSNELKMLLEDLE